MYTDVENNSRCIGDIARCAAESLVFCGSPPFVEILTSISTQRQQHVVVVHLLCAHQPLVGEPLALRRRQVRHAEELGHCAITNRCRYTPAHAFDVQSSNIKSPRTERLLYEDRRMDRQTVQTSAQEYGNTHSIPRAQRGIG